MQITIFAKRRQSNEGKVFYNYLSTLTNREGVDYPVQVKFREDCGQPKADKCPMNIIFDKKNANLTHRQYTNDETGEIRQAYVLWVSEWKEGPEYIDRSLDDFED